MKKPNTLNLSNLTYETIECNDIIKKFEEMTSGDFIFISASKPGGKMEIQLRLKNKGHYVTIKEESTDE